MARQTQTLKAHDTVQREGDLALLARVSWCSLWLQSRVSGRDTVSGACVFSLASSHEKTSRYNLHNPQMEETELRDPKDDEKCLKHFLAREQYTNSTTFNDSNQRPLCKHATL
jgi:hypothetical protein